MYIHTYIMLVAPSRSRETGAPSATRRPQMRRVLAEGTGRIREGPEPKRTGMSRRMPVCWTILPWRDARHRTQGTRRRICRQGCCNWGRSRAKTKTPSPPPAAKTPNRNTDRGVAPNNNSESSASSQITWSPRHVLLEDLRDNRVCAYVCMCVCVCVCACVYVCV